MTKKELLERELRLEAIVSAYHEIITQFCDSVPFSGFGVGRLEEISVHLFNEAEVREDIGDLVQISFEMEE